MHMIGHHNPGKQAVTLPIEMQERSLDHFRDLRFAQNTTSMSGIDPVLKPFTKRKVFLLWRHFAYLILKTRQYRGGQAVCQVICHVLDHLRRLEMRYIPPRVPAPGIATLRRGFWARLEPGVPIVVHTHLPLGSPRSGVASAPGWSLAFPLLFIHTSQRCVPHPVRALPRR